MGNFAKFSGNFEKYFLETLRSTLQNPPSAPLPQSFHLNLDLNNLEKDGEPAVKISFDLFTAEARHEANLRLGGPVLGPDLYETR